MIEGTVVASRSGVVFSRVKKTESAAERMKGLLGCTTLYEGDGLLIVPCNSIHTFFMKFPIDVVFLNREDRVVKIVIALKPFRFAMSSGASSVLELRAKETARAGIRVGDHLRWFGK